MAKKQPLSVRIKHDPKLRARVMADPGLRSKLDATALTPAQRAKRQLNTRLNAPVTAGSSMTYRDAARTANAQTAVKYGGAEQALGTELGHAQGLQRDTPQWYDQYKADLAQHAQNVQGIGAQGAAQLQGQAAGIRGLDQASLTAQQGAADASAAQRGATAGNLGPDASNASTVRQALLASMAGSQAGANTANSTYADTLARVVAPGQKLQALAQAAGKVSDVRGKQTQLASEKGAFNLSTRQQIAADEGKNVLAQQALGLNTAKAASTATTAAQRVAETARHNKASESNTAASAAASAAAKAAAGDHYGYTNAEWATKTPAQRAAAAKKWKQTTGAGKTAKPVDPATADAKAFYAKYGVKPAATAAVGNAKNQIQTAASLVNQIRQSNPGLTRQQIGQLLLNGQAGSTQKGKESLAIPKQKGLWATVALDLAWFHGKISAGTASKLHSAGYSVKTLGLTTVPGGSSSTYVTPPKTATTGSRGDG